MSVVAKRVPAKTESRQLITDSDTHIAMGSKVGGMNAGTMKDWLKAMREMQKNQRQIQEWQVRMSAFLDSCASWLNAMSKHVIEVAVVQQDRAIYLFAVLKTGTEITLDLRRAVADFGITMGAVFDIRTEARLTSSRPSNCKTVIEHANQQTAS